MTEHAWLWFMEKKKPQKNPIGGNPMISAGFLNSEKKKKTNKESEQSVHWRIVYATENY